MGDAKRADPMGLAFFLGGEDRREGFGQVVFMIEE
jgi:hypothetical protein